ncbi:MAG TPA: hypothetical protein VKU87_05345 [Thermomicrobiaceae bacterium]|nr:hypothetical protein [Thermomicrobiaceae bacterium]
MRDIEELIEDAFSGRSLTAREVQAVVEQVAMAGFDPERRINAPREIAGLVWEGQQVEAGERIAVNAAHYLKHVVLQREWPDGTTLATYEADAIRIARDPRSGVFVSSWQGQRTVGVIGFLATACGLRGSGWILVEYRVAMGHWVTVFQPVNGLRYIDRPGRARLQWLRHPD